MFAQPISNICASPIGHRMNALQGRFLGLLAKRMKRRLAFEVLRALRRQRRQRRQQQGTKQAAGAGESASGAALVAVGIGDR